MSDGAGTCAYCQRQNVEIVATATLEARSKSGVIVGSVDIDLCDRCADAMTREALEGLRDGLLASLTLSNEDDAPDSATEARGEHAPSHPNEQTSVSLLPDQTARET